MHRRWLAPIAALVFAAPSLAQTPDLSQTVTFGDSLTGNDILGFPFRIALYGDDPAEAAFKKARRAGDKLTSYAVPGTTSNFSRVQLIAYATQFANGRQKLGTFFSYEMGGNDVLNGYGTLRQAPPGRNAAADAIIDRLIDNLGNDLLLMFLTHPRARFVVWTIPDVTYTPRRWNDRNTTGGANVRAHIERVNKLLRTLDQLPNFVVLETDKLIRGIATTPPVVKGRPLVGAPSTGRYDGIFADSIHPTAVANALVANEILAAMNRKWRTTYRGYNDSEFAQKARR